MKKLCSFLYLAMFIELQLFCNPLPSSPVLKISEFMFNSDSTWVLELVDDLPYDYHFDSIFICSSTGKAKVKDIQQNKDYCFNTLITPENLLSPLNINKEGDSITIVHFYNRGEDIIPKTVLTFGNYPDAMISKPAGGQSIVGVSGGYYDEGNEYSYSYYSKNNKPSLGNCEKDINYMCGNLRGKIYDNNGQPLYNRTFKLGRYESQTDSEGNYNLQVFANTLVLDTIRLKKYENMGWNYNMMYGFINFIQMEIEVGDIIDLDIHIKGDLVSSSNVKAPENPVKFYPNPLKQGSELNYEIDLPVFTANIELEVLSLTGQQLLKKKITNNAGIIDLQVEPGTYILNCTMTGKSVYSSRIIITQ